MRTTPEPSIHHILAHSYLMYFVSSIIGLFIDTLIGFSITVPYADTITGICFGVGALLILWAQYTSRHSAKKNGDQEAIRGPYFFKGPYRYMRNPTHLGMVILVTGYTLVSGSIVFFAITVIGYLVSNIFFHRYEAILDRTYGEDYQKYQASVPKIL
ncbi:MAG: hypothetical protein KBB91_02270 [Candidatus Pacebacteria bacterium]|nr:hypothetical protein [Candidatus Paceibacterota bacterium]MBP9701075.1 hypothetical protein [Candidatus Paceibacterota bacterium]